MAVLLTGGAGFIGSHTAVELLNAEYDVIIADNFSNSSADVIDRIETIAEKRVLLYDTDICDKKKLNKIFDENDISCVLHFAGYKAVGESVEKPVMYYRNNIDSTLTLLEAMNVHGVKNIVFSSSATVYGDGISPYTEDSPTGSCSNPYGRTKYFIENILSDVCTADSNACAVLLRYFNPIGAHESGLIGEKPNGIPNNLIPYITQTAVGIREHLNIYGNDYDTPDGTGVRDYIHVVDLAKGHVSAVKYTDNHTGCEAFNLGTGNGLSVLEIIHAFERVNGVKIPYVIAPRRNGDIAVSYACADKAERLLGWKAEKTVEDMCRDSWRWQQSPFAK